MKKKDDLDRFKENAMKDPEVKQEYDKLGKEYKKLLKEIEKRIDRFLKNKEKLIPQEEVKKNYTEKEKITRKTTRKTGEKGI